jgi:tetratricopeptide (TPR) repeat protein
MAKVRLRLPGTQISAPMSTASGHAGVWTGAELRAHTELGAARRSAAPDDGVLTDAEEHDVVELRWESGIVELVRVGDLTSRFGDAVRSGAGEVTIPRFRAFRRPTRAGDSGLALDAVQHIAVELTERLAAVAVPPALRKIESWRIPNPGLYGVNRDGSLRSAPAPSELGDGPLLVLIHGTFSSTADSFRHLFTSAEWNELYARYDQGRSVLALEHRTITDSPVANALSLLKGLPPRARLHLLSYSRGGLVGDLLCRRAFDGSQIAHDFEGEAYSQLRDELGELSRALFTGGGPAVSVERFLRVAAPAAGTQLAGRRLDQFLDVALTLLGKVADAGTGWFDFVKAVAVQIVSARTSAAACPGLEAMMPDSAFVRFLNVAPPREAAISRPDLAVVSGDVSGGAWYERLQQVFFDFYFRRRQNDFIVDTASMTRGVPRLGALQYHHEGANADHFSYFEDRGIRRRTLSYLAEGSSDGFLPLARGTEPIPARGLTGLKVFWAAELEPRPYRPELPTVFLLPGIMGTRLGSQADVVWLSLAQMAEGGLQKLFFSSENSVHLHGLIEGFYEKLANELGERFNVEIFAFDWRVSIKDSARELAAALERALGRSAHPVHLLAHSMGGLVSRGVLAWHRPTWDRLTARGGRLLMLGTPNFGSFVPVQAFTERHTLLRWLDRVDRASTLAAITEVVRGFPGLIEMLPRKARAGGGYSLDLLDEASWSHFSTFRPESGALARARAVRDELDAIPPSEKRHMIYVAGTSDETPSAVSVTSEGIEFSTTPDGDGTVPWELGRIEGVTTYFADASHGDLPAHERSFVGYVELLQSGKTARLDAEPPNRGRDRALREQAPGAFEPNLPASELAYFPGAEDLAAIALGATGMRNAEAETRVEISVVNSHVHNAKYPIIVGHYDGDPITSVEGVLDRWLGGQLARDHALGIYPGPIGTMRSYARNGSARRGVIVVGLGRFGALTQSSLSETLREALVRYAADRFAEHDPRSSLELEVTSLLVGSWGALSLEDSVRSLIAALRESNERLRSDPARRVRYVTLELIELYRDLATQTAHVLKRLAEGNPSLAVRPYLVAGDTFRRNRPAAHTGYYNRIAITADDASPPRGFRYDVGTSLARTEVRPRPIQWAHVSQLLARAPSGDRRAVETLFQYLVPIALQGEARNAADLVLELDDFTAQIPWELLGTEGEDPDGFARRGILRTLRVSSPRPASATVTRRALVMGEPAGVAPPLPGARVEATEVAGLLAGAGFDVNLLRGAGPDESFEALLGGPYDIVHVAAHGHFDAANPRSSGVVLADGRFLGASEFENMRGVPSVVFLNCCHLGKIHLRDPGPWAASLAKELIGIGVGVVVVAGWAVSDHAAVTFARTLYRELLDGRPLMSAVREARRRTRSEASGVDVTWGAYQVYGAPGFVLPLVGRTPGTSRGDERFDWVSPHELVEYVLDLQVRAREETDASGLLRLLENLQRDLPDVFAERGDVNAAFGRVYAALGRFEQAIACFSKAVRTSDADTGAVEQLANCEGREAARLLASGALSDEALAKARAYFASSRARLVSLLAFGESAERHALLGATLRRLSVFEAALGVSDLLDDARRAYERAHELGGASRYYPALVAQCLRLSNDPALVELEIVEAARALATERGPIDPDAVISAIELDFLDAAARALRAEPQAEPAPAVVDRAGRALVEAFAAVGATLSERNSTFASISLLAEARHPGVRAWYTALKRTLETPS